MAFFCKRRRADLATSERPSKVAKACEGDAGSSAEQGREASLPPQDNLPEEGRPCQKVTLQIALVPARWDRFVRMRSRTGQTIILRVSLLQNRIIRASIVSSISRPWFRMEYDECGPDDYADGDVTFVGVEGVRVWS